MADEIEQRLQRLESQAQPPAVPSRLLRLLPWMAIGHLAVGAPTLIISLIVAYGTYVQAQATQRMQQAAAWPFLAYGTSNYTPDGKHRVNFTLQNNGVGPALLGPIALSYKGRAMRGPRELLEACCGYHRGEAMQLSTAPPSDVVLRPGEMIAFMELADVPANARLLPRLESERWKVQVRSCYCSIFNECWIIEGVQSRPKAVEKCPTNWATYKDR